MTKNKKFFYKEDDVIYQDDKVLYRIASLRAIDNPHENVKKGELGGYIARGALSQEGNSWVSTNSKVCFGSYVTDDGYVFNSTLRNVTISGKAAVVDSNFESPEGEMSNITDNSLVIKSDVKGSVSLEKSARLDSCKVVGNLKMKGSSTLINCTIKSKYLETRGIEKVVDRKIEGEGNLKTAKVTSPQRFL